MANTDSDKKTCPFCGETIQSAAVKCRYCRSDLTEAGESFLAYAAQTKLGQTNWKRLALIAVVLFFVIASAVCFGIWSAIVSPGILTNAIGSSSPAKEASVRANMRTVQIAVESYASDHEGCYPATIDRSLQMYFPGGNPPINPFTAASEWPLQGKIQNVEQARASAPPSLPAGVVEYSPIQDSTGRVTSYAIIGGGHGGSALRSTSNPSTTLVCSNQ